MNIRHKNPVPVLILLLGCLLVTSTVYAQKVQVDSAEPSEGEQSTTLVVTINGNGFGNSAAVRFLLSNTENLGDVSVDDVQVVSRKKLVATIKISEVFDPQDYDIEVENLTTGRRGKGHTMFRVLKKGGGNVDPTFDVTYTLPDSPVKFSGLNWHQKTSSSGISYWRSDPKNGEGWINLDYFRDTGSPFGDWGVKCFGSTGDIYFDDFWWTHIEGVQLWEDNNSGIAILNMNFIGTTANDENVTLQYHLHLEGFFDPDEEFPPLYPLNLTRVVMTTWRLQLTAKKLRKRYSEKSCVGEGVFETDIWVERN